MRHLFLRALLIVPMHPAWAQDATLRADVAQALDAARPVLMGHLWDAIDNGHRGGEVALLLLAAIHDGVDAEEEAIRAAVEAVTATELQQTYDLALRLMVMAEMPTFPERAKMAVADVKALLRNRNSGAFGYSPRPNGWDLSNTQYAALGLRAGRALGVKIKRSVWQRLAKKIGAQQDSYGGFGYRGKQKGYASMTAAGIAVLAVCRQALAEEDRSSSSVSRRIERGWSWFERYPDAIGEVSQGWPFYFHYGLERAAILCDVEKIAGFSWYERGARMLVDRQLPSGGWGRVVARGRKARGRGDGISTAFAVLFLRRGFKKILGPTTPRAVTLPTIGPASKPADIEACAEALRKRGMEAMPEVLRALRSEYANRRRAAAIALEAIAGRDFDYDPGLDENANREAVKRAELWYLRNR